jgi:anti-sigma B factor antagonist
MILRFRETPDEIIVFFSEANISDDLQILEVRDLFDFCKRAAITAKGMVFDFRSIQLLTSAMIGELVLLNKATKQQSLDVRFVNLSPDMHEVFKITRLHKLFRIDDDDPGFLSAGVPNPKPPDTLDGGAESPSS